MKRFGVIALVAILIFSTSATIAFAASNGNDGCTHAEGHLVNIPRQGGTGRMTGTITGDYQIDSFDGQFDPDSGPVTFSWLTSHVDSERGSINFSEYAALDFNEQQGQNGAVLLLVTGGTGDWANASGHITLSGFFHTSIPDGEWDYEGDICMP